MRVDAHKWEQLFSASAELVIEKLCKKQNNRGISVNIKTFNALVNYLLVAKAKLDGLTLENRLATIGKN